MTINKTWLYVGAAALIAVGYVFYRRKQSTTAQQAQQQPAADAQANYTVPPDLGLQVDNTGGVQLPQRTPPGTTITTTRGQTQPLPLKK